MTNPNFYCQFPDGQPVVDMYAQPPMVFPEYRSAKFNTTVSVQTVGNGNVYSAKPQQSLDGSLWHDMCDPIVMDSLTEVDLILPQFRVHTTFSTNTYVAPAINWTNAWTKKTLSLTDSTVFTFSVFVRIPTNDTNPHFIWIVDPANTQQGVLFDGGGTISFFVNDTTGANSLWCEGEELTLPFDNNWHHISGYADTNHASGSKVIKLFFDGYDVTGTVHDDNPAFTIAFNGKEFAMPDDTAGSFLTLGSFDMAEFYFGPGVLQTDMSVFADTFNRPNNPSGWPAGGFKLTGDHTNFLTNSTGTYGALTLASGSLTDASSSPSS